MKRVLTNMMIHLLNALCVCAATAQSPSMLNDLPRLGEGTSHRTSSADSNWRSGNKDWKPLRPGQSLVLADIEGPGIIRHIWFTAASVERHVSRLLMIRAYWDGETSPSIEVPLGDFFGVGHGLDVPMSSWPVQVSAAGLARNCYWAMPFRKSAKIVLTNEGEKRIGRVYWNIDWEKVPSLSEDMAYFHARYAQQFPTQSGKNYVIADIQGAGHYVGTVLSVRARSPGWWGEGDDLFFIDGEAEPGIRGTGTEDYFNDAWGLRTVSTPHYGVPVMEGYGLYDRASVYRWHVADPVRFRKSLRLEIEHRGAGDRGDFTERADDFSSVAFWYQREPHKPFPPMPLGYARFPINYNDAEESEVWVSVVVASPGTPVLVQTLSNPGPEYLSWDPTETGQSLSVPVSVESADAPGLLLFLVYGPDHGAFSFEFGGKPVGTTLDLYSEELNIREVYLPLTGLEVGRQILKITLTGKHDSSGGHRFGIDGVLVLK